jgi:hypothetical protein
MNKFKKVFLGGTFNSAWREALIPLLTIDFFNPVVKDWNPECQAEEIRQREVCDVCLYVITPRMTGVYAIAEVIDDSNKRPDKTVFCFINAAHFEIPVQDLEKDENRGNVLTFKEAQLKSLTAVGKMVEANGATWIQGGLEEVAVFLNKKI